jgi:hypothetical protein
MKRIGLVVVLLAIYLGCSSNNGERFIGRWQSLEDNREVVTISKDGDKYIVRDARGAFTCELSDGLQLKCAMTPTGPGAVTFMSRGHILWLGMDMKKLPPTSR